MKLNISIILGSILIGFLGCTLPNYEGTSNERVFAYYAPELEGPCIQVRDSTTSVPNGYYCLVSVYRK